YWLSIGLAIAYIRMGGEGVSILLSDTKTWIANLLLLQSYLNCPHVWGVFWTLPCELLIYAVCSLLFACRLLNRIGGRVCITLMVVFALSAMANALLAGKPGVMDGMRSIVLFPSVFGLIAYRYVTGRLGWRFLCGLLIGLAASVVLTWAVNHT